MALTRQKIEQMVREHVRAEGEQDYDALRATLLKDVEYEIKTPAYPDDPTPYGHFTGDDTYIAMWRRLFEIFVSYDIVVEDVLVDEPGKKAWVTIKATAVPREDFHGLPKGKSMTWWSAAMCFFDDEGRMTKETVYGSFPPVMAGFLRMKEFTGR